MDIYFGQYLFYEIKKKENNWIISNFGFKFLSLYPSVLYNKTRYCQRQWEITWEKKVVRLQL